MKPKVFIDGKEGTTGLQIYERLGAREDIELLFIDEDKRKDPEERRKLLNAADLVFLCLPDAAAREAVSFLENRETRVIDASTAHRTAPGWVYGFPELSKQRRADIEAARRVANPGCHATGFISLVYPLVQAGMLQPNYPLTCFSLTGYSGGGKKMIAQYEQEKTEELFAPRIYGLNLNHKHIAEMMAVTGLERKPVFSPIVDDYYKGMATSVALHNQLLPGWPTAADLRDALAAHYEGCRFLTVAPLRESGMLQANWGAGTNQLEITVCGDEELTLLTARFDNLGKGASGAAVQNMNLMLGFDEAEGLSL